VARVLHEPVAVAVAALVNPGERSHDVRPQPDQELDISGAIEIRTGQHHEQRRRVHAAVVAAERHLAEASHLAAAGLVQDLSRFGVLPRVHVIGLRRRQVFEDAARDARVDPERLERGDDAVTAERRAEPGHSRIGILAVRRRRHQHPQIGGRSAEPVIEAFAGAFDHRVGAAGAVERRRGLRFRAFERLDGGRTPLPVAANGERQHGRGARCELVLETGHARRRGGRHVAPLENGRSALAIQAAIVEAHRRAVDDRRGARAAALTRHAAHFEDVGEVRVDVEGERHAHRQATVVPQAKPLVPRRIPQESSTEQVDQIAGEHAIAVAERDVRIRQVGAEQLIVVLDARAQQQRPLPVHAQLEPRQIPGALVIQPLLARQQRSDIADGIEEREGVVVLQHRRALRGSRSGRQNVELVVDLNHVFHSGLHSRGRSDTSQRASVHVEVSVRHLRD
jgi:hypothetical protein